MILNHCQLTAKQTGNLQPAAEAPAMRRAQRQPRPRCCSGSGRAGHGDTPGAPSPFPSPQPLPGTAGSVLAAAQAVPQRRE